MPISATSVSKIEEESNEPLSSEDLASQIASLASNLDALVIAMPKGFEEMDAKVLEAFKLLEEELRKFSGVHDTLQRDLFGIYDPEKFLGSFTSFAHAIECIDAASENATQFAKQAEEAARYAAASADQGLATVAKAIADATQLDNTLTETTVKTSGDLKTIFGKLTALEQGKTSAAEESAGTSSGGDAPYYAVYHHNASGRLRYCWEKSSRVRTHYEEWLYAALFL